MSSVNLQNAISANLAAIQEEMKNIPTTGAFTGHSTTFPIKEGNSSMIVQLSILPWTQPDPGSSVTDWNQRRYFEVKVTPANHRAESSEWVCSGTNAELTSFFQDKEQALTKISTSIQNAVQHLQRDFS